MQHTTIQVQFYQKRKKKKEHYTHKPQQQKKDENNLNFLLGGCLNLQPNFHKGGA